MRKDRTARWLALGAVAAGLAVTLWFAVLDPRVEDVPTVGQGDYRLETTEGAPFTAATLTGRPSAIFFGYTHCPDVCPTTLGDIALWQQELGDRTAAMRFFLVTVDPERDTIPVLADYLSWSEGIIGVTGTEAEIAKALEAFRIYAQKVSGEGADYSMDHSASVLLFDAEGRFSGRIGYQEPVETVLPKLRALIPGAG
ncbi:SCO family protein [Sinirhodobacter populi]|uniref:SCO family protein n=1 Tax=Paenirhodobacter populi TaxID=2306993 RepID=A0A443KFA1_9RHOB|nr:SCO family protein [Sinirhodobacter populi]RWR31386.1 SCO family protein [Sinirhodobacter populi]